MMSLFDEEQIMKSFIRSEKHDANWDRILQKAFLRHAPGHYHRADQEKAMNLVPIKELLFWKYGILFGKARCSSYLYGGKADRREVKDFRQPGAHIILGDFLSSDNQHIPRACLKNHSPNL